MNEHSEVICLYCEKRFENTPNNNALFADDALTDGFGGCRECYGYAVEYLSELVGLSDEDVWLMLGKINRAYYERALKLLFARLTTEYDRAVWAGASLVDRIYQAQLAIEDKRIDPDAEISDDMRRWSERYRW